MSYDAWHTGYVVLIIAAAVCAIVSALKSSDPNVNYWSTIGVVVCGGLLVVYLAGLQFKLRKFSLWLTMLLVFFAVMPALAVVELLKVQDKMDIEAALLVVAAVGLALPFISADQYCNNEKDGVVIEPPSEPVTLPTSASVVAD